MYYLNDKHSDYEYVIYCKRNYMSLPYLMPVQFSTLREVKHFISENIEKTNDRYGYTYYIDNDFYDNKYSQNLNGAYYKVLRRKVNDWKDFRTTEKERIIINYY